MRGTLFTLMWVACSVASAGTVYKWVDENGVTHYSDQPHENAAKVDLHEPQTYSAPRLQSQGAQPTTPAEEAPYSSCAVLTPSPEQVFTSTFSITVQVQLLPSQHPGDQVVLTLDGKPLSNLASTSSQITIPQIDRGTHSIQAAVQNGNGQTVCQSPAVTFYIRQPSTLGPNRPRH